MKRKAERTGRKQGADGARGMERLKQLLLPMVVGMANAKDSLMDWFLECGRAAFEELLDEDAARLAGPRGKHRIDRQYNHWGRAPAEFPFGGRKIVVGRPRVRSRSGREMALPSVARFRRDDPVPERVVEQVLLGVSSRGYESSIGAPPPGVRGRGASKSATSRNLVARTKAKMHEYLSKRLDDVEVVALFLDGIHVAGQAVIVALGVTLGGTKVPLGLWVGSTESAAVCTALLQDLVERGLRTQERILCVIDGAKGLRRALADVLGDHAVVQRCQVHKKRNVLDHLPRHRHAFVRRHMRDAYKSGSVSTARRLLRQLVSWLERNGEDQAAGSLREGLDETLTVLRLGLPTTLTRSFSTTNAVENLVGTVRRVTRNVKRWRGTSMIRRWTALAIESAHRKFRRIKGHRDLGLLVRALRKDAVRVDAEEKAA